MSEYLDIYLSKHLKMGFNQSEGMVVLYKGFPLWRTAVNLDQLDIKIYDPNKKTYLDDPNYYILECTDNFGDKFFYGRFSDINELCFFLDDPFAYNEQQENLLKSMSGELD